MGLEFKPLGDPNFLPGPSLVDRPHLEGLTAKKACLNNPPRGSPKALVTGVVGTPTVLRSARRPSMSSDNLANQSAMRKTSPP